MPEERSIELEIKEALDIDETNILEELRRHSSKYFYYGVLWARANKTQRRVRMKHAETEARLTAELRQGTDKVTEAIKQEYLARHPEYMSSRGDLIQAEYMTDVLEVARDAMKQRGMALQELAKRNREEEIYGDEFKAMKKEYQEQVEDIPKKRHRRTKAEMEAANERSTSRSETSESS